MGLEGDVIMSLKSEAEWPICSADIIRTEFLNKYYKKKTLVTLHFKRKNFAHLTSFSQNKLITRVKKDASGRVNNYWTFSLLGQLSLYKRPEVEKQSFNWVNNLSLHWETEQKTIKMTKRGTNRCFSCSTNKHENICLFYFSWGRCWNASHPRASRCETLSPKLAYTRGCLNAS